MRRIRVCLMGDGDDRGVSFDGESGRVGLQERGEDIGHESVGPESACREKSASCGRDVVLLLLVSLVCIELEP
jgi:hypothetical protein